MRTLVLLCLLSVAYASDVIELNSENFDSKIKKLDVVLVQFYAPWCGHCKKMAPEYEISATKLLKNDPAVNLAKVDCTLHKPLCEKWGATGYPTMKIYRAGEYSSEYEGPRVADGITKYMRGQVGEPSKQINSVKELQKFVDNEEHSIIGFFETETKLADGFRKVADTDRDRFRFGHTTNPKVIEKYGYTDEIIIFQPPHLQNKFEESEVRYDGNYDTDKIKKFLETQQMGLCGHRDESNAWQFARPLITVYFPIDFVKDVKGTNYWRNRVLKVAHDFRRKVNFCVANMDDYTHELTDHGLLDRKDKTDKPLVAAVGVKGQKYFMDAEFTPEALRKFAKDLQTKKLMAYMKSEPIPKSNDDSVKQAVGHNFFDIVKDNKDVFIEFYAPWCGHCKTLAPVWQMMADMFVNENNIVIAKMDGTLNDVPPPFAVAGFPTIFFKPANKLPVQYTGGRELDDLMQYVARHATKELSQYDRSGRIKKTEL